MTTSYFDVGCENLNASQDLKLKSEYSAVWLRPERGDGIALFLEQALEVFNPLDCYFWLASTGGARSPKIVERKGAFGISAVPIQDVIHRHKIMGLNGEVLHSDIAVVRKDNSSSFVSLIERQLFGIDSIMFFLAKEKRNLIDEGVVDALEELLTMRNQLHAVTSVLHDAGLVEGFVDNIVEAGGVATVVLRDSNASMVIAAIGNQFALGRYRRRAEAQSVSCIGEEAFVNQLAIGLSISALS